MFWDSYSHICYSLVTLISTSSWSLYIIYIECVRVTILAIPYWLFQTSTDNSAESLIIDAMWPAEHEHVPFMNMFQLWKSFHISHQLHSLVNVHTCGIGSILSTLHKTSPNASLALIDNYPSVDHESHVLFCIIYCSLSLTSTYSRFFMNAL